MGSCYAPESRNSNKHVISVQKLKSEDINQPVIKKQERKTEERKINSDKESSQAAPVSESERKASRPILTRLIQNQKKEIIID